MTANNFRLSNRLCVCMCAKGSFPFGKNQGGGGEGGGGEEEKFCVFKSETKHNNPTNCFRPGTEVVS